MKSDDDLQIISVSHGGSWHEGVDTAWDPLMFYKYFLLYIRWRQLQIFSVSDRTRWPEGACTALEQLLFYKDYLYQMEPDDLKEHVLHESSCYSTKIICIRWRQLTWRSLYCMRSADVLQILSISDGGSSPEGACTAWDQLMFYKYSLYQMKAATNVLCII